MKVKYLRNISKYDNIIIYGAGVVGKEVFLTLKEHNLHQKVKYFVVTDTNIEINKVFDIEVRSINDIEELYKKSVVLIAVSEKYIPEVTETLKKLGIKNYIDVKGLYFNGQPNNIIKTKIINIRNELYCLQENKKGFLSKDKIEAVHITQYLITNTGDTVLSWCVRRYLNEFKWNLKKVTDKVDEELINKINRSKAVVVGGGGLFLPDTNANNVSGWQWAISNKQIENIKVPLIIYSVGYNFFKGQENTEMFKNSINCIVRKASFVGLRNTGSIEAIRNILDEDLKDKVIFQPCTTTLIRKICRKEPCSNSKIVVFNVAFDREERRYGKMKEEKLLQIARAAKEIQEKGYKIVYVAHCHGDFKFLSYLDREKVNYKVKNLIYSLPREVIKFYRKSELVIGMRGHAQMIPFGVGVKIISLGTHDKNKWFLQDVNLEECYVDINNEYNKIKEKIMTLFEEIMIKNPVDMNQKLRREQDKLWKISLKNREKIQEIVQEKSKK